MGRRTYASKEPYVLRLGESGAEHLREFLSGQIEDYTVGGWRSWAEDDGLPDYTGNLFPWGVTDGKGALVLIVNTHPYAAVGQEDWAIFGQSLESLVSFAKALGVETPDAPVKDGLVEQTL